MSHTVDLLNEVLEFLEPYVDVVDGSYGEPHPNKAMSLTTAIEQEIERLQRLDNRLVCYWPCEKHQGIGFTMTVGAAAPPNMVCPICEPPK